MGFSNVRAGAVGQSSQEKEVIIFSAVRCNTFGSVGFLKDWRRLNVMVTRARRALVVIGGAHLARWETHTIVYGCGGWRQIMPISLMWNLTPLKLGQVQRVSCRALIGSQEMLWPFAKMTIGGNGWRPLKSRAAVGKALHFGCTLYSWEPWMQGRGSKQLEDSCKQKPWSQADGKCTSNQSSVQIRMTSPVVTHLTHLYSFVTFPWIQPRFSLRIIGILSLLKLFRFFQRMVNCGSLGPTIFNTGDKPTNWMRIPWDPGTCLLRKVKKALEDGENFQGKRAGCGGNYGFLGCTLRGNPKIWWEKL